MLLPIILVVRIALMPWADPIQVGRFETESECKAAATKLDRSTRVILVISCEVET